MGHSTSGRGNSNDDNVRVQCNLGELLTQRGMTLSRLSEIVEVNIVNLSILKNNKAKAIRFSTLEAICEAMKCDVGDLFTVKSKGVQPMDATSLGTVSKRIQRKNL
jgi:putative transcriptional regulator